MQLSKRQLAICKEKPHCTGLNGFASIQCNYRMIEWCQIASLYYNNYIYFTGVSY